MTLEKPQFHIKEFGVYGFKLGELYLLGMPIPPEEPGLWSQLDRLGIKTFYCTTHDTPPYEYSYLELGAAVKLADSVKGLDHDALANEEQKIRTMVSSMCNDLRSGRSVVCHCKGGTGRTGTLMAGVLRELGHPLDQILSYMKDINEFRGKGDHGWPELEWQMELIKGW